MKLFSVLILLGFCIAANAEVQTKRVTEQSGSTLADKVNAAQTGCTAGDPCVIIFPNSIGKFPSESLPSVCADCTWIDERITTHLFPAAPVGNVLTDYGTFVAPTAGPEGPQGIQGVPGNDGAAGAQGIQGETGLQGIQGIQGIPGNDGATGSQGTQGPPGNDGAAGAQGIQGIQGIQGEPGAGGVPSGAVVLILSGSCPATLGAGWTEAAIGGKFLLATTNGAADIGGTGGADSITEILNHTHAVNVSDSGHVHGELAPTGANGGALRLAVDTNANGSVAAGLNTASATTGVTATTDNPAGGVASIDNRPAYVKVIFCQKD